MTWLLALTQAERDGEPAVLLTVIRAVGSVPRAAGAKMVVTARGQADTVGGGALEHRCVAAARDLLGTAVPVTRDFPLGPALGQCCGGHVTVLFEPIEPAWRVVLFGAGHVGRAVAHVLATLPCEVDWIDPRDEQFPRHLPANVRARAPADPEATVTELPASATVVVMTHDHALDFAIVAAALARDDLGAVLLIGSATKRARFVRRLGRGMGARLICPIGDTSLGKRPAEVAIATAAELLRLHHSRARDTLGASTVGSDVHGFSGHRCSSCGGCGEAA